MSFAVKLDTGAIVTSNKSSGRWDRHSLYKRWPFLPSKQKDTGLPAASIFIWKDRRSDTTEELDHHSRFCPVTTPADGKALPPQLCPKIHTQKWKSI